MNIEMKYEFEPAVILGRGVDVNSGERFPCLVCSKSYLRKRHLQRHMRDECIGIPPRFSCELCPSRFRRKYHMVRHLTSKHSIPPNIAQHATGGGMRNNNNTKKPKIEQTAADIIQTSTTTTTANTNETMNLVGAENLSMRKDLFVDNGVHFMNNGNISSSPAHSAGAGSSSGTRSPLPAHLPTYGLSGAITALSNAAAATLAAEQLTVVSQTAIETVNMEAAAETVGAAIKTEPISPTKLLADDNKMDEDWKIKLSLQLISNSLLKERLMNTIPFGTGYNNNN